jgi:hypothetical protein
MDVSLNDTPQAQPVAASAQASARPATAGSPLQQGWRQFLAEPLLHFLILGGLLFGVDHALLVSRGDPSRIDVPDATYIEAKTMFAEQMKRDPSPADMKALIDRWVDNEVLYREALAMALDKGDPAIRERVIFKSLNVVQSGLSLPAYDENTLRQWFEAHRSRYDTPLRFDFLEAEVSSDRAEDKLRAFVDSLNGKGRSDTDSSLSVFKDRPRTNIEQSYGAEFAQALERARPNEWLLVPSTTGLRVVRLQAVKPGLPADYAALRNDILKDWKDEAMSLQTTKAVRELWHKYRITRREDGQ